MKFPDLRGKKIVDFELKKKPWGNVFDDDLPDLEYLTLQFDDGSRLTLNATDHNPEDPSLLPDYTEDGPAITEERDPVTGLDPWPATRPNYVIVGPREKNGLAYVVSGGGRRLLRIPAPMTLKPLKDESFRDLVMGLVAKVGH